jgi:hypothetical protein
MDITRAKRDELSEHIEKNLILNESQLQENFTTDEKFEARLLDHSGKCAVARAAIRVKSPVEVFWLCSKKTKNHIIGTPRSIEKSGDESILVVSSEQGDIKIPLQKVSHIRRIR